MNLIKNCNKLQIAKVNPVLKCEYSNQNHSDISQYIKFSNFTNTPVKALTSCTRFLVTCSLSYIGNHQWLGALSFELRAWSFRECRLESCPPF